eukprot:1189540-Prorocentrum_minimum.AAC.1
MRNVQCYVKGYVVDVKGYYLEDVEARPLDHVVGVHRLDEEVPVLRGVVRLDGRSDGVAEGRVRHHLRASVAARMSRATLWMLRAMLWMFRAMTRMLRAMTRMLRAMPRMLRATVWMLRATLCVLRAIVWMLRAMLRMLRATYLHDSGGGGVAVRARLEHRGAVNAHHQRVVARERQHVAEGVGAVVVVLNHLRPHLQWGSRGGPEGIYQSSLDA